MSVEPVIEEVSQEEEQPGSLEILAGDHHTEEDQQGIEIEIDQQPALEGFSDLVATALEPSLSEGEGRHLSIHLANLVQSFQNVSYAFKFRS